MTVYTNYALQSTIKLARVSGADLAFLHDLQRLIEDRLAEGFVSLLHHGVDELACELATVNGIRLGFSLDRNFSSGHRCFSFWGGGKNKRHSPPVKPEP